MIHDEIACEEPAHQTGREEPRPARRPRPPVQVLLTGVGIAPRRGGRSPTSGPAASPHRTTPRRAIAAPRHLPADYSGIMTDTANPRLSRLIRDTEGFLLPLTEVADDVLVTRVEFGFDLPADDTGPHRGGRPRHRGGAQLRPTRCADRDPCGSGGPRPPARYTRPPRRDLDEPRARSDAGRERFVCVCGQPGPARTVPARDLVRGARSSAAAHREGRRAPWPGPMSTISARWPRSSPSRRAHRSPSRTRPPACSPMPTSAMSSMRSAARRSCPERSRAGGSPNSRSPDSSTPCDARPTSSNVPPTGRPRRVR
jgi:hypothetical protein